MNIRPFLPLVFFCLSAPMFAADTTSAPIKPGRYILIMHGATSVISNPDPIFVRIKPGAGGGMTVEPEKSSKGAIAVQTEGNSLVFSLTTPGHDGVPPEGQDWYVAHMLSFAGKLSQRLPNTIEGVFSDFAIYAHPTSDAPHVLTGEFSLVPIDAD